MAQALKHRALKQVVLALDAMGGDNAPHMVIEGAALAFKKDSSLKFQIYGDMEKIKPLLENYSDLHSCSEFVHTPDFVKNDEKPSVALRQGRNSSMRLAIDAVVTGKAQGVVSAGNTGAYMAMAKIFLKMLEGIDRPAIVSFFPTYKNPCVMLDMGANVSCDEKHLVQFALMGTAYAKEVLGVKNPTVGLLNVGAEEQKGHVEVQEAARILKRVPNTINFHGFVEGDDIAKGTVDIIVTDGFTGNVALKTIEGMVFFIMSLLKEVFKSSWLARLGYLLSLMAFKPFKDHLNPKNYNGAMLIGLRGVAIKSHGGADALAFSNAIKSTASLVSHGINEQIEESLKAFEEELKAYPEDKVVSIS